MPKSKTENSSKDVQSKVRFEDLKKQWAEMSPEERQSVTGQNVRNEMATLKRQIGFYTKKAGTSEEEE